MNDSYNGYCEYDVKCSNSIDWLKVILKLIGSLYKDQPQKKTHFNLFRFYVYPLSALVNFHIKLIKILNIIHGILFGDFM